MIMIDLGARQVMHVTSTKNSNSARDSDTMF